MPANIYNEGYGFTTSQSNLRDQTHSLSQTALTNSNKTTHNKESNKQTTPKQEFETIFNDVY